MAKPTSLPQQAWDNAAEQAQSHLPIEIPPVAPSAPGDITLPGAAVEHMSLIGVAHLPDWLS
jgi:hypothetical protein